MRARLAKLNRQKAWRRFRLILANSLNQIILILFSPLLSFLVIRAASLELWGSFVEILIVVQLGAHIAGWGNKEYLLRTFSRNPAGIREDWQSAFVTRLPLLGLLGLVLMILYPAGLWPFLLLWAIGLFLSQSYDVLVVYRRDFIVAALVEGAALCLLVGAIFFQRDALSTTYLVTAFGVVQGIKGGFYALFYRRDTFSRRNLSGLFRQFAPAFWPAAFPFFLLTFSGMLNSRIDLYIVSIFLPPREVAEYQVFINFLLYLSAAAGFILLPFVKSIYRLDYPAILKLAGRLFLLGLLLVPLAMPVLILALRLLYGIDLPFTYFIWGALYVLPVYFFLPFIYAMFKAEKQSLVIGVNLSGVALNVVFDLILLPQMGSEGAILAAAAVKWLVLITYTLLLRHLMKTDQQTVAYETTLSGTPGPPGIS